VGEIINNKKHLFPGGELKSFFVRLKNLSLSESYEVTIMEALGGINGVITTNYQWSFPGATFPGGGKFTIVIDGTTYIFTGVATVGDLLDDLNALGLGTFSTYTGPSPEAFSAHYFFVQSKTIVYGTFTQASVLVVVEPTISSTAIPGSQIEATSETPYKALTSSAMKSPYVVREMMIEVLSDNSAQINEQVLVRALDSNGELVIETYNPVLDPYQLSNAVGRIKMKVKDPSADTPDISKGEPFQPGEKDSGDGLVLDGINTIDYTVLGGEDVRLTFFYEPFKATGLLEGKCCIEWVPGSLTHNGFESLEIEYGKKNKGLLQKLFGK